MSEAESEFLYVLLTKIRISYIKGEKDLSLNEDRANLHLKESPRRIRVVEDTSAMKGSFLSLRSQPVDCCFE